MECVVLSKECFSAFYERFCLLLCRRPQLSHDHGSTASWAANTLIWSTWQCFPNLWDVFTPRLFLHCQAVDSGVFGYEVIYNTEVLLSWVRWVDSSLILRLYFMFQSLRVRVSNYKYQIYCKTFHTHLYYVKLYQCIVDKHALSNDRLVLVREEFLTGIICALMKKCHTFRNQELFHIIRKLRKIKRKVDFCSNMSDNMKLCKLSTDLKWMTEQYQDGNII